MRLIPSEPDLATLVARIDRGDIDLQPDFQRGEVWNIAKQQKLIDTILRNWYIPPIHIIEVRDTARTEVLDGQQRLASIRNFYDGVIRVDGSILPADPEIEKLDGYRYKDLPDFWKRRIDQFPVRVFRVTDYEPEEPGELFHRLNSPTNLTAGEQRNAFYGPAREQIKKMVYFMEQIGLDKTVLGFSNSRMAYDDVIAKVCYIVEIGTLRSKVTAQAITEKYRSREAFSVEAIQKTKEAIKILESVGSLYCGQIRFNKATLFSWLLFIVELGKEKEYLDNRILTEFINLFESNRSAVKRSVNGESGITLHEEFLLSIFNDRASFSVADVSSVVIRDLLIWIVFGFYTSYNLSRINILLPYINRIKCANSKQEMQHLINKIVNECEWGLRYENC